jgi:hypothetical protein
MSFGHVLQWIASIDDRMELSRLNEPAEEEEICFPLFEARGRKAGFFAADLRCRLTHKFAKTGRYASEEENGEDMGSRTRLVIRNRTRSAWERERVALVRANSLEDDARARGLLECTIRITKPVREPISSPKRGDMRQRKKMARIWDSVNFGKPGIVEI